MCASDAAECPGAPFDLIVLSEILYFLPDAEIAQVATLARTSLMPRGRVLLVNWLGAQATSHPGDHAAEIFIATSVLTPLIATREKLYRLDLLEKPGI